MGSVQYTQSDEDRHRDAARLTEEILREQELTPEERGRRAEQKRRWMEQWRRERQRKAKIRAVKLAGAILIIAAAAIVVVYFFFGGLGTALGAGLTVVALLGYARWVKGPYDSWVEVPLLMISTPLISISKSVSSFVKWSFSIHSIVGIAVVGGLVWGTITLSVAIFHTILPSRLPALHIPPQSSVQSQLTQATNLSQVQLMPNRSLNDQVIVHPYVLENRLFIYTTDGVSSSQVEVPQNTYARFHERLLINLGFTLNIDYLDRLVEKTTVLRDLITTQEVIANKDTVLVADGALHNTNFQQVFQDKLVFRSSSLNTELITNNLNALGQSPPLNPNNTFIINGIPSNPEEMTRADLNSSEWSKWEGIQETWQKVIYSHNYNVQTGRSASDAKEALRSASNVLIVVAHSDGQTIFLPDGTSLSISDLESIQEEIQQNKPIVALFACETAKVNNGLKPFSQALIDLGAKAVIAPVSGIGARSTSKLLDHILQNSAKGLLPIEAISEAIQETGMTGLENWIGYHSEPDSSENTELI